MVLDDKGAAKPSPSASILYSIKSRKPSALSNSASALEGRRAAALPNNPNRMVSLPMLFAST